MREPVVEEKVKTIIKNEALASMATSAAFHFRSVEEMEDEVKAFTKSKKVEIEDHKNKAMTLLEQVRLGYKYETVLCFVVRDHNEGEVHYIATKTCQLIKTREMIPEETQMEIEDSVPDVFGYEEMKKARAKLQDGETTSLYFFYGLLETRHPTSKNIKDWARKTKSVFAIPEDPTPETVISISIHK